MDIKSEIQKELRKNALPTKIPNLSRFFKAGPGEYAEGDLFLGISVPKQKQIAKKYFNLTDLNTIASLLKSPYHEDRLTALFLLVLLYQKKENKEQNKKEFVLFYLKHAKRINNWDLVDSSADKILGSYLWHHKKPIPKELVHSKNLWENRIAILACFYFIKQGDFTEPLRVITKLLHHKHDLIHKANGWMLREIGKRSETTLRHFLSLHAHSMPRTTLRYALEKFSKSDRDYYYQVSKIN